MGPGGPFTAMLLMTVVPRTSDTKAYHSNRIMSSSTKVTDQPTNSPAYGRLSPMVHTIGLMHVRALHGHNVLSGILSVG